MRATKDTGASVRQRLLNLSKSSGQDFQLVLVRYGIERALHRLFELGGHPERFALKGAGALVARAPELFSRPTKDLDLWAAGPPGRAADALREALAMESDDGLAFDPGSVRLSTSGRRRRYEGVRLRAQATLGRATRVSLSVDLGFGDAITPAPCPLEYPGLLEDLPGPTVRAYPLETLVAEKFHAACALGLANTRIKDFFDLAFVAGHFAFEAPGLFEAISRTFERRLTPLPRALPPTLRPEFEPPPHWEAAWRSLGHRVGRPGPASLAEAIEAAGALLGPLLAPRDLSGLVWAPAGPWERAG